MEPAPIDFTEDFPAPKRKGLTVFSVESYSRWVNDFLQKDLLMPAVLAEETHIADMGDFTFEFYKLPLRSIVNVGVFFIPVLQEVRSTLPIYSGDREVHSIAFDGEVSIPRLYNHNKKKVWFSLTPNEVITQRGQLRRAKGNVAIAGLGMGWLAHRIAAKKNVHKLTVVESSPEVAEFFGKPLKSKYPDKVTVISEDAYQHDFTQYDVSLWDIWPEYGDAAWDRKFEAIKKTCEDAGKVCLGWGFRNIR